MHRTHLPLVVWFWAIYLVATDKHGYSAKQPSRELEIPYKSAWYLLHRIRNAMSKRDKNYVLSGSVVVDETFYGAAEEGGQKRPRNSENQCNCGAFSREKERTSVFENESRENQF